MNNESVGKLFKGNFGMYECVAYSDKPSVVMKNINTNESICVSIDSNYAKTFELIEEDKKIEKLKNEKQFYAYVEYEENKNDIDKILYILKALNLTEEKIDNLNNKINEIIDKINSMEVK